MTCRQPIADQLLPYTVDQLTASERFAVEEHLEACGDCKARIEILVWMKEIAREYPGEVFEDHVGAVELERYESAPEAIAADRRHRIERHLALCEECASDLTALEAVSRELAALPDGIEAGRQPRHEVGRSLGARISDALRDFSDSLRGLSPIPTTVAALLLLYPAFLGTRQLLTERSHGVDPGAANVWLIERPTLLESIPVRGTAIVAPTVPRNARHAMRFDAPISTDSRLRYDVELVGPDEETIWRQEGVASLDAFGTFTLVVDTRELAAGRHRLLLHEITREAEEVQQTFVYAFRVEAAR